MAITKNTARQCLEVAFVDFALADLVNGSDVEAIDLPPNAVITAGSVVTTQAFNSGTTDVIDVGDATTQNRYLNDASIAATGVDVLVPTGHVHTGGAITVRWTGAGTAATTGRARLQLEYYVVGRAETTFG